MRFAVCLASYFCELRTSPNCRLDANDISPLVNLYLPAGQVEHPVYEAAMDALRQDLVGTAAFLATELLSVAVAGNTLLIDGL